MFADSETAYWTFAIIAEVSASITGLLFVAAVFFIDRFVPSTVAARRILKRYGFLYSTWTRIAPDVFLVLLVFSFGYSVFLGLTMTDLALDTMRLAPGLDANQTLYPSLADDISRTMDETIKNFHYFLMVIGGTAVLWIGMGIFVAVYSKPRYDQFEESMARFERSATKVVKDEYERFCQEKGLECRRLSAGEAENLRTNVELLELRVRLARRLIEEWDVVFSKKPRQSDAMLFAEWILKEIVSFEDT